MTVQLANVTFDCNDTLAVARFWSAALDRPLDPEPSEYFASIGLGDRDASGPNWLFAQVPERKTAKNRCHVDLHTEDRDAVAREVERLVTLGATMIRPPKEEFGTYWATLQDPEGNEFCIGAR
jgi:predicted enzyme related to lactoylglutathione lyase